MSAANEQYQEMDWNLLRALVANKIEVVTVKLRRLEVHGQELARYFPGASKEINLEMEVLSDEAKALLARCERQLALIDGQARQRIDLAADHTGMRVDYSGLIEGARLGLAGDPGIAEMLRQLSKHLGELGRRWYAGDRKVVDEFLQLYCIESDVRAAVAKLQPSKGVGVADG